MMQTLDRRDCMKKMLAGMAFLAAEPMCVPAFSQEKTATAPVTSRDKFWQQVDQVKARNLVQSLINAARAGVQSQREINAQKRATILLGADAGQAHHKRAETLYQTRTAELKKTKDALQQFVKTAGASGNKKFTAFVQKGNLKELTAHARQSSIQALLTSDISPQEAQAAVKALDDRLGKVQGIGSFEELTSYLNQHLDELIGQKMPEEDPNGLCVLILIISSIFAALLVVAIIICIFSLGFACKGVLDQLIAQICP